MLYELNAYTYYYDDDNDDYYYVLQFKVEIFRFLATKFMQLKLVCNEKSMNSSAIMPFKYKIATDSDVYKFSLVL